MLIQVSQCYQYQHWYSRCNVTWNVSIESRWWTVTRYLMSYILVQKCLKEFRITCWTCLEKASLVHFISLQNFWSCVKSFDIFKTSPTRDSNSSKRQLWSDFSPNLDQTCLFEQFESGPNLPFDTWSEISKRNKMDQTCLFETSPTRDSELLQTLFWTKI